MSSIGIDFGTSTTLAAQRIGRELAAVLPIGTIRPSFMPSVAFTDGDRVVVGEDALNRVPVRNLIRWVKRAISEEHYWLPEMGAAVEGPVEPVIHAILKEVVARVRVSTGLTSMEIHASLSCPSSWNWSQRQRLISAAASSGIDTRVGQVLVDEPVAAAAGWMEWMVGRSASLVDGRILVIDVGGGTLDVALIDASWTDGGRHFRVLASSGTSLGGHKLDEAVARAIAEVCGRGDLVPQVNRTEPMSEDAILALIEAERVKLLVDRASRIPFQLRGVETPGLRHVQDAVVDVADLEADFHAYVSEVENFALAVARNGLLAEGRTVTDSWVEWPGTGVSHILLVGGGTRLRMLQERFRAVLPEAHVVSESEYVSAEEMVVRGLSLPTDSFSISLDRPHFSMSLKGDRFEHRIYAAYDPIVRRNEPFLNNRPAVRGDVPLRRDISKVFLSLVSVGGSPLRAADDVSLEWHIPPDSRVLSYSFYPDGLLLLRTDRAPLAKLRLPEWNPYERHVVTVKREPLTLPLPSDNPYLDDAAPG